MATYSKIILSGSTDGEGISVTGLTPSTGTVVHTAVTGAADSLDEVWLYAYSAATVASEVFLAIGPTTSPNSRIGYTVTAVTPDGLHMLLPGLPLRNAKVVKAYATAVDKIKLFGYVQRYAT